MRRAGSRLMRRMHSGLVAAGGLRRDLIPTCVLVISSGCSRLRLRMTRSGFAVHTVRAYVRKDLHQAGAGPRPQRYPSDGLTSPSHMMD